MFRRLQRLTRRPADNSGDPLKVSPASGEVADISPPGISLGMVRPVGLDRLREDVDRVGDLEVPREPEPHPAGTAEEFADSIGHATALRRRRSTAPHACEHVLGATPRLNLARYQDSECRTSRPQITQVRMTYCPPSAPRRGSSRTPGREDEIVTHRRAPPGGCDSPDTSTSLARHRAPGARAAPAGRRYRARRRHRQGSHPTPPAPSAGCRASIELPGRR